MIRKTLLAGIAVACLGSVSLAGPNAGGTLVIVTQEIIYSAQDEPTYCDGFTVDRCDSPPAEYDGDATIVLHVLAVFGRSSNPRLAGVTFGVDYDDSEIFWVGFGSCGDFELTTDSWPAPGEGTAVTWAAAETQDVAEIYWIAACNYYLNPNLLALTPHPNLGAEFVDDYIPANIDEIAALGSFGFSRPGNLPLPDESSLPGACCVGGSCEIVPECDCIGEFMGPGTQCDPSPCLPTATIDSSWGRIKHVYSR